MNFKIKLKTPITYYGGKQTMLKHIMPLLPEHGLYCEPFAGGAAVFFAKERAKTNVINDLNSSLIAFYKVLKNQPKELKQMIDNLLHSRSAHDHAWYIYSNPEYFTELQIAWSVFVLSKQGYAGQLSASFGFDKQKGKHPLRLANSKQLLSAELINLLENTTIECDDALAVIKRYDCVQAFFFVDPPYVGANMGHYTGMFNDQNLVELLNLLATIKGKFMLTMYPNDVIKSYADKHNWNITEIERVITASQKRRFQKEWIIMNY